ncbi:MAG: mitochondrial fission ELM1 family protein [Acetobacteraceae bacterium]
MSVAVISENFAGMRAQAEGLLHRLDVEPCFQTVRLEGMWRHLPTRFCPDPLKAAAPIQLAPETQWLLSVGGRGGAVGAALRRKTGLKLVQVQNPRMGFSQFDLIIANHHDNISGPNVISIRTALHNVTSDRLASARAAWAVRLQRAGRPLLCVMLGGSNGRFRLGHEDGRLIGQSLAQMVRQQNIALAITPSRRTDRQALAALEKELEGLDAHIWRGEGDNPYLGMLASADMIAVTTDSVSMISEALATKAPVQIIPLPGRSRRISAFVQGLTALDRVRPFMPDWHPWGVSPLDDTEIAVEEVRKRLLG